MAKDTERLRRDFVEQLMQPPMLENCFKKMYPGIEAADLEKLSALFWQQLHKEIPFTDYKKALEIAKKKYDHTEKF